MSYIQSTQRKGQRLAAGQSWRPAYGRTFAYLVFAIAFVFTGAVIFGIIP